MPIIEINYWGNQICISRSKYRICIHFSIKRSRRFTDHNNLKCENRVVVIFTAFEQSIQDFE